MLSFNVESIKPFRFFLFYLDFTARQDYFTHFEPSQSKGGAKTGDPREKPPDDPQAELKPFKNWPCSCKRCIGILYFINLPLISQGQGHVTESGHQDTGAHVVHSALQGIHWQPSSVKRVLAQFRVFRNFNCKIRIDFLWFSDFLIKIWARPWENVSYVICEQQRRRSACASAQSDQRLCCLLLR